jgi:hypothetical protein
MTNYTKLTDFASKDALPTGNAAKIVKGTEIDDEFEALEIVIETKADIASPAFTGTPTAPTAATTTNTTQLATTAFVQQEITSTFASAAGTGLEEASRVVSISDTGVAADTYGSATEIPEITVNAQGQITAASSVALPTPSYTGLSDSISNNVVYDLPTDTFLLSGTSFHSTGGNSGSRLDVYIYDAITAGGTLLQIYTCGGGNETNGSDGGSGMSVRDSFTICLPADARSVKFVQGSGSTGFSGNLEAAMTFPGYHS